MSKRVVRILSYEGNPQWVDATLRSVRSPFRRADSVTFDSGGTIMELQRIELEGEETIADAFKRLGLFQSETAHP